MPTQKPLSSDPPPTAGLLRLAGMKALADKAKQERETSSARGGFVRRPVTAANGTQGRTVYAQDGFRFSPEEVLDVERMGRLPSVQEQVLRSRQAWAESPNLGVGDSIQAEMERLREDFGQRQADWSQFGPAAEILANFERERLERGGAAVEAVPEFPVSTTTSERLGQIPRPSEGMRNIYGQYGEGERAADPRDEFIKRVDRFFSESDSPEDTRKRLWDLPVDFLKGIVTEWGPRVATKEDMARRDEAAKVWAQKRDAEAVREIAGASFAGEGPPLPRADPIRDAVSAAGPGVQPWPIPYTSPLDQPLTERVATETPIRQTGGDAGVAQSVYEPERRRRAAGLEALSMSDWTRPGAEDTTGLLSGRLPEGAVPVVSPDQSSAAQEILAPDGVGTVVPIQPSVSDDRQVVPPPAAVEQRVGPSVVPVLQNQADVSDVVTDQEGVLTAPVVEPAWRPAPWQLDRANMTLDEFLQKPAGEQNVLRSAMRRWPVPGAAVQAEITQRKLIPEIDARERRAEINSLLNKEATLPGQTLGKVEQARLDALKEAEGEYIERSGRLDYAGDPEGPTKVWYKRGATEIIVPGATEADDTKIVETVSRVDRGYRGDNPQKPPGTITLAGGSVDGVTGTGVDRDSIQRRILDALDGVSKGPAKKVDATAVAEKARAAGDVMRNSLEKRTRTLIDQQDASIDKIAKADKAGLKKISESMTALKDFQETGRLPKKHRQALINAGLMKFGAELLKNPDLYTAFSAGLEGFQEIEKGKRKEYLDGLKYALTAETAQQALAMKIRNSEAVARRRLAQFQIAQQSRDEAAAAAAEKRYTDATNDARRFEIMERTAATGKLSALATILNAIKPDKDARMFNMLLKGKLEEAQALAERGDVRLLNEAFIYDEKTHQATPRMGYFIDLFASMDPAAAYRAMAGARTLGYQQRTEARAVDRIVSAKVEDLTKGWNTSADWLKIHPEKRMPSVAEWQDDKERARLIALARAWVQRRTPGWQPSQGQRNSDPVNLR